MRGGTSKGPFFLASDLPMDIAERDRLLLEVMGSGHPLQIDGIGGGNALTSKVAIIDRSSRPDADVDYLFAQVRVEQQVVDTSPNCGNMLAAVGPYAIERGLVQAQDPQTEVRIHNVNTGKLIIATVETPGGNVVYRGDTRIAGAPGSASPVRLAFLDAAGARTGKLLPSGHAQETIDGVPVSLVDCAMPMMLVRAEDLGVRGDAPPAELNADAVFMRRLEALRIEAAPAWASLTPATRSFRSRCCCRRRNMGAICGALFHAASMPHRAGHYRRGRPGHRRCYAGHAGPHFGRMPVRSRQHYPRTSERGPGGGPQSQLAGRAGRCQRRAHRTPAVRRTRVCHHASTCRGRFHPSPPMDVSGMI